MSEIDIDSILSLSSLSIPDEKKAAFNEQLTAITEVNTAIGQMDQVTQQNAAMVEESTAVSHKMAEDAQMLAEAVNEFQLTKSQGKTHSNAA